MPTPDTLRKWAHTLHTMDDEIGASQAYAAADRIEALEKAVRPLLELTSDLEHDTVGEWKELMDCIIVLRAALAGKDYDIDA